MSADPEGGCKEHRNLFYCDACLLTSEEELFIGRNYPSLCSGSTNKSKRKENLEQKIDFWVFHYLQEL